MGYTGPLDSATTAWKVTGSPERYIDLLKKSIIGIKINIERLEGKFKISQELPAGDRAGVIEGFQGVKTDVATSIAKLVKEPGDLKEM